MSVPRRRSVLMPFIVVFTLLGLALALVAGDLDAPGAPEDPASASYTLQDLLSRLTGGVGGTPSTFTEPAAGPTAGTMPTINELMDAAPAVDDGSGAAPGEVLEGKTFWGLRSGGSWGPQTGAMTENGGTGAGVPKTGQTTSYATGDDGDLQHGVPWPDPRFTDHEDGTVTDELTGLMWGQAPHGLAGNSGGMNWSDALTFCNALSHAGHDDWRLPNVRELQSLIDYGQYNLALPSDHPFAGVRSSYYWSGSARADSSGHAWFVYLANGGVNYDDKAVANVVWPVRGGQ